MPKMIQIPEFLLESIDPRDLIEACNPKALARLITEQGDDVLALLFDPGTPPAVIGSTAIQPAVPKRAAKPSKRGPEPWKTPVPAAATKAAATKAAPIKATTAQVEAVASALGAGPLTIAQIAAASAVPEKVAKRILVRLVKELSAATEGVGRWTKYVKHPSKLNGGSKQLDIPA